MFLVRCLCYISLIKITCIVINAVDSFHKKDFVIFLETKIYDVLFYTAYEVNNVLMYIITNDI